MHQTRKLNIVIADDDLDDQFLIKTAIKEACIEVASINCVYNGLQLLDLLLSREAYKGIQVETDLIFLDINMPLMDGIAVLSELRKANLIPKYPVYVLSTSRNNEDVKKALAAGAKGFYNKPPSFEELKAIVKEVCENERG
jgi:CheY-like chemotaxis protein